MADSSIEWTDKVWNPIRGCSKVSAGCKNCYAERMASRFSGPGQPYDGLVWRPGDGRGTGWTGEARFIPSMLTTPLSWRKPCRVFVNSMSDLFHESLTDDAIDAIFGAMWACLYIGRGATEGHTFQVLTKRPQRMLDYLSTDRREAWASRAVHIGGGVDPDAIYDQVRYYDGPHPRIHLGVSIENQAAADERVPLLLQCPAAVRWVSCEPLLGAVDLCQIKTTDGASVVALDAEGAPYLNALRGATFWPEGDHGANVNAIDWVVVGGESGPNARPMHPFWAMALRDQCRDAGVPYFFKQWGEWCPRSSCYHTLADGRDLAKLDPESKRWPCIKLTDTGRDGWQLGSDGESAYMQRVGKKMTGDLLEGKRYQMFPGDKW